MFLEEQIQKLQRRVKNIEQNPRPEYLQSNKLRYQNELDRYIHVMEAWKAGKPFAVMENIEPLAQALGFVDQGFIEWGDRVSNPQKYYDIAVNRLGFPAHTCDRTITSLGLFLSGEVPLPRLMTGRRVGCDPERWSMTAAAKFAGVLFYDLARQVDSSEHNVGCMGEQLEALVEFAERSVPGIKYNEEKLVELIELDQEAVNISRDTYQLRKRVPCPISPQDSFRLVSPPSRYPNPHKVLEYYRMYRDELFERAEKGIGGVREEKLRVAWLATGPYGKTTFDLLVRKGVSLPWFQYGVAPYSFGVVRDDYGDDSVYGRKLKPLEEMIRRWNQNVWGELSGVWLNSLVTVCRELNIDAVVDFLQAGCVTIKDMKRLTAQTLEEQLGIPTLDLEGRELFSGETELMETNRKLEEFVDMCIANKKSRATAS